jgi:hypothetical protein
MNKWIKGSVVLICFLCGCTKLTDGDKKVCSAAASGSAQKVFDVAALAENQEIKKQASRIQLASSKESDRDAMREIIEICKKKGWIQ